MYRTWSVPKGGHEDSVFMIRIEYGLQPYKEEMLFKGSGNMKMSEEEIKKYTEAISKNSDNLFVCPRCKVHTDKLKANIKTHLKKKKPCTPSSSSSVVQNVQVTNDHSTHTINDDHSIHNTHNTTINNANITIQLQPINCPNPDWEDLINNNCIKTIEKRLGCSLSDAGAALLACLIFQHLNADLPQRHNVRIIRDGLLEIYRFADDIHRKKAAWKPVPMEAGLKDLICRRRLDFVDVQESLQHKLPAKRWKLLEAGLDELENLSNDGESKTEEMKATFDKLMDDCEAAIARFCRPLVV